MNHWCYCLAAWALACGGGPDDVEESSADDPRLYDPKHTLEVEIEMDPDDFDALRTQTRDGLDLIGEGCLTHPPTTPFTYFDADVTIDGRRFERVGVRKKGFYGSLSDTRPSFKVKLDHVVDDQEMQGIDLLTLNNNLADPSQVKQCIGYRRFRDAGLPASRCTLATVSVNGARLGLYSNVESIDKAFLRRNFDGEDEGNLYEGALSDFRPQWVDTFERKGRGPDDDRTDLDAVVAALDLPDEQMARRVADLVDLERFYDFWALEVLLMHADGYTRQTNNSSSIARNRALASASFPGASTPFSTLTKHTRGSPRCPRAWRGPKARWLVACIATPRHATAISRDFVGCSTKCGSRTRSSRRSRNSER